MAPDPAIVGATTALLQCGRWAAGEGQAIPKQLSKAGNRFATDGATVSHVANHQ
jgi:hypothetical protein